MLSVRLTVLFFLFFIGVLPAVSAQAEKRLSVIVSLPPQAFIAQAIGGEVFDIETMIPTGANHEQYEPSIKQLRELSHAALYVKLGHPHFSFETLWIDRALKDLPAVKVVQGTEHCRAFEDDPHLWLSLDCLSAMAKTMTQAFSQLLPERSAEFADRAVRFEKELAAIRLELHQRLEPYRGRSFLIYHPAWGYFAKEFGLEQLAIEVEGKEADAKHISEVMKLAKARKIKTIFVQPQFSLQSAKLVASEIGAQVVSFDPLQENLFAAFRELGKVIEESFR